MKKQAHALPRLAPALLGLLLLAGLLVLPRAQAEDAHGHAAPAETAPAAAPAAEPAEAAPRSNLGGNRKEIEATIRNAMGGGDATQKRLNLLVDGKAAAPSSVPPGAPPPVNPVDGRPAVPAPAVSPTYAPRPALVIRPRPAAPAPAAHAHEVHWSYEGENGPANWASLKPEFSTCATGKRQSPIAIEDYETLKGPAEPLDLRYNPSRGTVVNNGHTIQVNVNGDNTLTVRGSTYQLLQFHFHSPSEERVNGQTYPLVAHFVHRNDQGQLAVLAVLFETGAPNTLVENVWTYMPLDTNDSVRMPPDLLNVNVGLPTSLMYYQFMGSLTTPPCTEGVLWMVLKQPSTLSREQLRVFTQIYPNNARPVQPRNDRPVRNATSANGALPSP
jgi:carbonic anhydrase